VDDIFPRDHLFFYGRDEFKGFTVTMVDSESDALGKFEI
jgi:hypothetical protein